MLTLALLSILFPQHGQADEPQYAPRVEEANGEGEAALQRVRAPEGWTKSLWAEEPHLANAVCLYVDHSGKVWVVESFRVHAGVTDMRSHMDWLEDELAAQSVEDRVAFMQRREGENFARYGTEHDRIKRIVDTDGDGRADSSTVFADGFKDPAMGIAAGVLVHKGDVWFTNIPDLWRLRDLDDDGISDERESLFTGFGVKIALLGHDMHGLRIGLDGRLYWSIGDRGLNVEAEGQHHLIPDRGAVLRCERDGTGLQVYATGLRNPQELAFDVRGDLFTGDNNSDAGDQARWVYVVPGSDTGWRHHYQYVTWPTARGPWNAEGQWKPPHEDQPWFLLPPIANVGSGPSGLARVPDQGWGDLSGAFMLCDFRGGPGHSSIRAVRHEPQGAGFRLLSADPVLEDLLPTDCDFGPDGQLYVSDWVNGWGMTGKGRVFRVSPPGHADDSAVAEVAALLGEGFTSRSLDELQQLLLHPSFDVRLEAQIELVDRAVEGAVGSEELRRGVGLLLDVAGATRLDPLSRLHGIWGAQEVARRRPQLTGIGESLLHLAEDADPEVRVQVLRALGDLGLEPLLPFAGRALLADGRREQAAAMRAMANLGRSLGAEAVTPLRGRLLEALDAGAAQDPWLRNEAFAALEWGFDEQGLVALLEDERVAIRRSAVVALRRRASASIVNALDDPAQEVAEEAARAVHEFPIPEGREALASRLGAPGRDWMFQRRALGAARELHRDSDALALADFAAGWRGDGRLVEEALRHLAEWGDPRPIDPVIGSWRPVPGASLPELPGLSALAEAASRTGEGAAKAWIRVWRQAGSADAAGLQRILGDQGLPEGVRAEALRAWAGVDAPSAAEACAELVARSGGALGSAALEVLAREDEAAAVAALGVRARAADRASAQAALGSLLRIDSVTARAEVLRLGGELGAASEPTGLELELVEALRGMNEGGASQALAAWDARAAQDSVGPRAALVRLGGDVEQGRKVFREQVAVGCLRCHQAEGQGSSEVGPHLDGVAGRLSEDSLLKAILEPNAELAEEYRSWTLALADGTLLVGRILEESAEALIVLDAEGTRHELSPEEVEGRRADVSSMPGDLAEKLSDRELRDLLSYLRTLR